MTKDEALSFLKRDGNLRVPCSRYGSDTESCAPVAIAVAEIVAEATGEALDSIAVDHAMGLVVNDHDDVFSLIVAHGRPDHRELIADEIDNAAEELARNDCQLWANLPESAREFYRRELAEQN